MGGTSQLSKDPVDRSSIDSKVSFNEEAYAQ